MDKIVGRPRLPYFTISRSLFARELESSDAQLIVLRGAAGIGKSSALADWAERQSIAGRHGAWVEVHEDDTNESLWQRVFVRLRESALTTQDSAPARWFEDPSAFLKNAEADLIIDAARVPSTLQLEPVLLRLANQRPRFRVVLASRTRTTLEGVAVLASQDCQIIRPERLLFTVGETAAALAARGLAFETGVARQAQLLTGGYAVAVGRLAAHMVVDQRTVWRARDVEGVLAAVEKELSDELLGDVRIELGPFWSAVQGLSLLPYASTDLANALAGSSSDGTRILENLENAGLGTWVRRAGEPRFMLLDFVKRLLQNEAEADPDGPNYMHAASLAEQINEPMIALELAVKAGDWGAFSELSYRRYAELATTDLRRFAALVTSASLALGGTDPWLLFIEGALAFTSFDSRHRQLAENLFHRAAKVARESVRGRRTPKISAIRIASARRSGGLNSALSEAEHLDDAVSKSPSLAGNENGAFRDLMEAYAQSGMTLAQLGMYSRGIRTFTDVFFAEDMGGYLRVQAAGYVILLQALRGEVNEARAWVDRLHGLIGWSEWRHTIWAVPAYLGLALVDLESQAVEPARQSLRVISALGVSIEEWPLLAYVSGMLHLVGGNAYSGFTAMRDIEVRYSGASAGSHMQSVVAAAKSDLMVASKQARAAVASMTRYLDGRESVAGAYGRALLFSGANERAMIFSTRWAQRSQAGPRTNLEAYLVVAVASYRAGDMATAAESLGQAVSIADSTGLRLAFGMMPRKELLAIAATASLDLGDRVVVDIEPFDSDLTIPTLTRRETVVLAQLRRPVSLEAIARELAVSPNTVKSQVRSIYRKLGVSRRSEAVRVAMDWRLVATAQPTESPANIA